MSRYDGTDGYVYPGTEILRNKVGLRDQAALDAFEADATAVRMLEMIEGPIQGGFDVAHICAIHRHLFQDVYDWAGELRTVDISREMSRFARHDLIESYLSKELRGLAAEGYLRGLLPEAFVGRIAHYMAEINAAHPFRDGNGRTQRMFCAQLADQAGYFIDFQLVSRDEMYSVMSHSFLLHDEVPLRLLLERVISVVE